MTTKPKPPRYLIQLDVSPLEGNPHDPAGWHRLRRFLKGVLRSYRLKCEDFRVVEPEGVELTEEST